MCVCVSVSASSPFLMHRLFIQINPCRRYHSHRMGEAVLLWAALAVCLWSTWSIGAAAQFCEMYALGLIPTSISKSCRWRWFPAVKWKLGVGATMGIICCLLDPLFLGFVLAKLHPAGSWFSFVSLTIKINKQSQIHAFGYAMTCFQPLLIAGRICRDAATTEGIIPGGHRGWK